MITLDDALDTLPDDASDSEIEAARYVAYIHGKEIELDAATAEAAIDEAQGAALDGWDTSDGPVYVDLRVERITVDDDGDECEETVYDDTIVVDQDEPDCERGHEHDWQAPHEVLGGLKDNPGVHGHGGGVIIREVCAHCGAYRIVDTWAQNPTTGQQGLHETRYAAADEASHAWLAATRLQRARDALVAATEAQCDAAISEWCRNMRLATVEAWEIDGDGHVAITLTGDAAPEEIDGDDVIDIADRLPT